MNAAMNVTRDVTMDTTINVEIDEANALKAARGGLVG